MARKVPEVNASSTADIAFLLLIFFLVTTTMDVDTGIARRLPPIVEDQTEQENEIKERNVFVVLINKADRLLVNKQEMRVGDLKEKAKEFIINPNNNPNLPEKKDSVFAGIGAIGIGKGVISLQNDRGTSYGMYIRVQNELAAAYNEARDEFATSYFGRKFSDLTADKQEIVKTVYPQRISEAEPKSIK